MDLLKHSINGHQIEPLVGCPEVKEQISEMQCVGYGLENKRVSAAWDMLM